MVYYWILIASWLGSASLQYINTGPGSETLMDPLDSTIHYSPLPDVNYFNYPAKNYEPNDERNHFYEPDNLEIQRKRRTAEEVNDDRNKRWRSSVDSDKSLYFQNQDTHSPLVVEALSGEDNSTDNEILDTAEKRSFSPWGGKRDKPNIAEHMWTWKRTASIREPSMPKRVRFSPWGGKRSGQMIFKPGTKGSKIIFSASVPELTRIVSNFSPGNKRLDVAGFQFVPTLDKRHPIKILALSTKMEDRILRDALPFNTFIDNLPKMYKPGHPYLDVSLKKDGKRKVKFSAWGGKRSPPIIGPIWTPASEDAKDSTLDTIVLVRNNQNEHEIKGL
ncbi:unnamed protein product, partial [Brenthis ino]